MKFLLAVAVLSQVGLKASAFAPTRPVGSATTAATTTWTVTAPSQRTSASRLFNMPDPLGSEGDWTAYLDETTTGLVYYFNAKNGESRWEPPTRTFPNVAMDRKTKRKAQAKRSEYEKTVVVPEKKKGFLATLLEDEPAASSSSSEQEKRAEDKGGEEWFSFLNDDDSKADTDAVEAAVEEPKKEGGGDWFGLKAAATATTEKKPAAQEVNGSATAAPAAEEATEKKPSFFDRILSLDPKAVTETKQEAGVAKELAVPQAKPTVDMAAYVLPHPAKIFWGGEDAVFTQGRSFGIFDGVSGATKLDGVPLYSKTLAKGMKKVVGQFGLKITDLTKQLTQVAEIADESATGASTAIVASIGEDGFLRALNLGDSSCIVIRNGKVTAKTRDISHYFDCPYQLSEDSPDRPRDGTKLNLELVRGDLMVMGSDGIFDNLSSEEIVDIVQSSSDRVSSIAKRVSDQSRQASLNKKAVTPYGKMAQKNGDPEYADGLGGKLDDVSCIVVRYA